MTESTIGFLPDDDGILRTFIDRYTTMLIHDSVYMEELPAPHFMHQSFSMLHPYIQEGGLKHDPREYYYDEEERNNFDSQPRFEDILAEAEQHDQA